MEHSFTPTEWKLMECLWEKGSVTGREAVDYLHAHAAWSRSTTLTMLRRMTEKGVIACVDHEDGVKTYFVADDASPIVIKVGKGICRHRFGFDIAAQSAFASSKKNISTFWGTLCFSRPAFFTNYYRFFIYKKSVLEKN